MWLIEVRGWPIEMGGWSMEVNGSGQQKWSDQEGPYIRDMTRLEQQALEVRWRNAEGRQVEVRGMLHHGPSMRAGMLMGAWPISKHEGIYRR